MPQTLAPRAAILTLSQMHSSLGRQSTSLNSGKRARNYGVAHNSLSPGTHFRTNQAIHRDPLRVLPDLLVGRDLTPTGNEKHLFGRECLKLRSPLWSRYWSSMDQNGPNRNTQAYNNTHEGAELIPKFMDDDYENTRARGY